VKVIEFTPKYKESEQAEPSITTILMAILSLFRALSSSHMLKALLRNSDALGTVIISEPSSRLNIHSVGQ
jgi:hypothetical protein